MNSALPWSQQLPRGRSPEPGASGRFHPQSPSSRQIRLTPHYWLLWLTPVFPSFVTGTGPGWNHTMAGKATGPGNGRWGDGHTFVKGLMKVELVRSGDWLQTLWAPTWAASGNDSGEPGCEGTAAESWLSRPGLQASGESGHEAQPSSRSPKMRVPLLLLDAMLGSHHSNDQEALSNI